MSLPADVIDIGTRLNAALTPPAVVTPGPGVYENIPFETYHAWEAASNSQLTILREQTPAHVRARQLEPTETVALRQGRALHCAVLEPDEFPARFACAARCDGVTAKKTRCTNMGSVLTAKGWRCGVHASELETASDSVTILPAADFARCLAARDAVWAHPRAKGLLSGEGRAELSLVWDDAETGILCKARHDRHTPLLAGGAIVDLKKTRDASPRAFSRSVYRYGYHTQGAWYLEGAEAVGLPAQHFVIIAQEDQPPFATAVYRLDEGTLDAGGQQLRGLVRRYAECVRSGEWPGYTVDIQDLAIPSFAFHEIDEDIVQ